MPARRALDLQWDATQPARRALNLRWDATMPARQALELQWDATQPVRRALELQWDAPQPARRALDLQWDAHRPARRSLRLQWGAAPRIRRAVHLMWTAAGQQAASDATAITIAGRPVHPIAIRITEDADQVAITAVLEFAAPLPSDQAEAGAAVVIDIWGIRYALLVESYSRSREFSMRSWTLTAASPAYRLQSRYADAVTAGPAGLTGQASGIARTLAAGIPLDWRLVDWQVQPLRLTPGGESPLDVLRNLVSAVGGVLTSERSGMLVALPWPPHRPDQWPGRVAAEIDSVSAMIRVSDSPDERGLYNAVTVSDDAAAGDLRIEEDASKRIGSRAEVLVYQVPWQDDFDVRHCGDRFVVLRDLGVEERVEEEMLEVVDGQAKTRYPIYAVLAVRWNKIDLGAITPAEDGTITTAVPEESLLYLTYKTRARRLLADMGVENPEPLMIVAEDGNG